MAMRGGEEMAFQLWHQMENNNNYHNSSYLKESLFAQQPKQQNNAVHSKYLA